MICLSDKLDLAKKKGLNGLGPVKHAFRVCLVTIHASFSKSL